MSTKKNTPTNKSTSMKTTVPTKKENPVLPSQDLSKPSIKISEVTEKSFFVDRVVGVKIKVDPNTGDPDREINAVNIMTDKDLANEPITRKKLVDRVAHKLYDAGYCLSDSAACEDALFSVEGHLGQLAHDIEYKRMCPGCTIRNIETMRKIMRLVREICDTRDEIKDMVKAMPDIIPCDLGDIEIVDEKIVDKLEKGKDITHRGVQVEIKGRLPSKEEIDKELDKFFAERNKK